MMNERTINGWEAESARVSEAEPDLELNPPVAAGIIAAATGDECSRFAE